MIGIRELYEKSKEEEPENEETTQPASEKVLRELANAMMQYKPPYDPGA